MPLTLHVSESGGFDLHDADEWHDGTILDIEETDGQWGAGLKWIIGLDGETADDGSQIETWAFCSQKLSRRSKLFAWAKGLGWDPDSETIDLEEYVNSRVQVMFERYDSTDENGNPIEKEKVVKLRKGKGKAPAKPKLKPVEDDEAPF
jgi:hypothetical protein